MKLIMSGLQGLSGGNAADPLGQLDPESEYSLYLLPFETALFKICMDLKLESGEKITKVKVVFE